MTVRPFATEPELVEALLQYDVAVAVDEPVIEVVLSTGDRSEATSPDDAIYVARTLVDDVRRANPTQGVDRDLYVVFLTDGKHVRTVEGRLL